LTDGQELKVRVREIDRGKVSLELVEALEGTTLPDSEPPSSGGGDRDRGRGSGDRDRGRGGRDGRDSRDRSRDDRPAPEKAPAAEPAAAPAAAGNERRRVAQPFDEVFEDLSKN
jgi:hypothetical protein